MNCSECKHCGPIVAGSSHHISCNFIPSEIDRIKLSVITAMEGAVPIVRKDDGIRLVDLDPYGMKNGWCAWPVNFDPIWVKSCQLFEKNGRD